MSWEEIASVSDKSLFEDCLLCGDTKSVELTLNDKIKTGHLYDQFGDGAGNLTGTIDSFYRKWNPRVVDNEYVGSEESEVVLEDEEITKGSNARNAGGYSSSHIRATLIGENEKTNRGYAGDDNLTQDTCVFSCIQEDLRDLIVPKKVKYITGTNYMDGNYTINSDIADSIWLFSDREVRGTGVYSGGVLEGLGDSGEAYDKFVVSESKYCMETIDNNSIDFRILYYEAGIINNWWLRSIAMNTGYNVRRLENSGDIGHSGAYYGYGLRIWILPFSRCFRL